MSDCLGPCDFTNFVAQSHPPHAHCVRFAVVVPSHAATLTTGRTLLLTRTGLSPVGTRQLSWRTRHIVSSMPAPVASGWSGCRMGLSPIGKRRLVTAHVV